jgi:RES domain-containing protein
VKRQAWRIVKARHAASAFSGEGASRFGGRWNSRGTWVVYVSSTQSLAALETLVHLNPPVPFRYLAFSITFDDALVETFRTTTLPPDWTDEPPAPSSKAIGDQWVKQARSAVLKLPSVIIPSEANYLLNPSHPHFPKIIIGKPEPFTFDPRLL